jgi:acetylglutamate synthase
MLTRDFPAFFWRARPSNPICHWYTKQCDGMARFSSWHVYWRGLAPEQIPPAIAYCLALPPSFQG